MKGMILCGTDLSQASEPALLSAAALARKHCLDLFLVTVLERSDADARRSAEMRIEQDAGELRRHFGVNVETLVTEGVPERKLLELAAKRSVSLIVVGAEGSARRGRKLGSVPEALCQQAEVPVFVARSADHLLAWSQGARPLRVLLGSGLGDASRSALELIATWPDLALTVAHVAWPFGEHYRLGVNGPMPLDHLRPEVHHQLLGDLGRWIGQTPFQHAAKLSVTPGYGRIDCHLAQLAREKTADLLVVGTHQRNLASRLWQGSVSRNTIHEASCNVLCVPESHLRPRTASAPRTIVIPTDFSSLADRAVAYGYALAGHGATVHLVHVVGSQLTDGPSALEQRLAERIPEDAESRGIKTIVQVLDGGAAWQAIWQYAGRENADLICMATHSRDAVKSLALGSQAQTILQHSRIPVLLVPPDRES
jgi:nucleotide-binding universal stress UspA family protein